ncbi:hypothetical protein [Clostridium perfringens]|uniref:hypothetical protein n=1 Tax=Clostridium perfringens TaxID=1502 RepID=UPI0029044B8C|nr:hypothetical protein [Clostridium perfringens]MDU2516867.1 hypothetical protein [Clostridium perfringens]
MEEMINEGNVIDFSKFKGNKQIQIEYNNKKDENSFEEKKLNLLKNLEDIFSLMEQKSYIESIENLNKGQYNDKCIISEKKYKDIIGRKEKELLEIRKEYEMKLLNERKLNKVHTEFLLISTITIIISLIGLLLFSATGFYIIHPSIYIIGILMGIGWGATCITSLIKLKRRK